MIEAFTAKRRRLGWSLRDVERESGIAFSTLARFERGERIGSRIAAGIATWVADPDPKRRVEVALTRDGLYLVGYSNQGEAGGFSLLGDITDQLAALSASPTEAPGSEGAGWIVGNNVGQWRTFDTFGWAWTDRRDLAVRYARREDAELVHGDDEDSWRVEQYPTRLALNEQGGG